MAFILFEMRLGGGGDKIQPKTKKNKQKNKQTHNKETGSKAVSIDTTVKTMIPWRRTYKKPLNCNSGDWSRSSPPPCALAMSCNLDWNQATNLTDNSKQGVSCLANGECRLITSQSVHYHSSYHQLKYLKLKTNLVCFAAGIQYSLIKTIQVSNNTSFDCELLAKH